MSQLCPLVLLTLEDSRVFLARHTVEVLQVTRQDPREAHSTLGIHALAVLPGHLLPHQPLKIQGPGPSSLMPNPFLPLSNAGRTLRGSRSYVHWRSPSKHCPGARGRRPAAMEAAGAGAEEDGLRSTQDAQLDGRHGCIRTQPMAASSWGWTEPAASSLPSMESSLPKPVAFILLLPLWKCPRLL